MPPAFTQEDCLVTDDVGKIMFCSPNCLSSVRRGPYPTMHFDSPPSTLGWTSQKRHPPPLRHTHTPGRRRNRDQGRGPVVRMPRTGGFLVTILFFRMMMTGLSLMVVMKVRSWTRQPPINRTRQYRPRLPPPPRPYPDLLTMLDQT